MSGYTWDSKDLDQGTRVKVKSSLCARTYRTLWTRQSVWMGL
jgi:hypothetical protein